MKPRTQRLLLSFFALILMLHISQSSQLSDTQIHLFRPRRLLASVATFSSNQNKPCTAMEDPQKSVEASLKKAPPSKSNPTHNRPHKGRVKEKPMQRDNFLYLLVLLDAPDEQSDNRGTLKKRKKLKAAEFAQWILASLSRNQDETPALKRWKVCNFFIKKSCRMERPKCTCNEMTQVGRQAIGPHHSVKVITPGMQNPINDKEMPYNSKFGVEDIQTMRKGRREGESLSEPTIW